MGLETASAPLVCESTRPCVYLWPHTQHIDAPGYPVGGTLSSLKERWVLQEGGGAVNLPDARSLALWERGGERRASLQKQARVRALYGVMQ